MVFKNTRHLRPPCPTRNVRKKMKKAKFGGLWHYFGHFLFKIYVLHAHLGFGLFHIGQASLLCCTLLNCCHYRSKCSPLLLGEECTHTSLLHTCECNCTNTHHNCSQILRPPCHTDPLALHQTGGK